LKREFDFLGYKRGFGGHEAKAGRLIRFNPCPVWHSITARYRIVLQ